MKSRLKIRDAVKIVCAVNALLIICVLCLTLYLMNLFGSEVDSQESVALVALSVIAMLCSIVTILLTRSLIQHENELTQTKSSLEELNQLNNTLRAQRHDYLNHLQVVYGLMELEQYDDANRYIERVYDDIQKVSSVLRTAVPAVNAILQAKLQMCARRGIEARVDIRSRLEGSAIPDWELCRVLGNIIDNAINALAESDVSLKQLEIRIFEDIRGFGFEISNNGPEIPENIRPRIFEAGFSSGSHKGDGMGLAICRGILARYNGELTVSSNPARTSFLGTFPKAQ